jgi:hypothetical protein
MKRALAAVILLAALGVLCKLALKPRSPASEASPDGAVATPHDRAAGLVEADPRDELIRRYASGSQADRELVERALKNYSQTAVSVERTDGLRGLRLLDRLDLEAVYLYEKHPKEFRSLRDLLDDDAAADILLHWREYFGLKRADDTDRGILVTELAQLTPAQRRLAARYPSALPLLLADPAGLTELEESFRGDEKALGEALVILSLISLENGASDLRAAIRTLEDHRALALEAFRKQGPDGFVLVSLYGPVLEAVGGALPLEQSLIVLRVNSEYVDELLQTHRPETVAGHLSHVAARGLVPRVGGGSQALRLVVEFATPGERALEKAGPDAADVVYEAYADPVLRKQAVAALGEHGTMALVILDKYATDGDFRDILRTYGAGIVPPIAQADTGPEALALLQSKEKRSYGESLAKLALLASGDSGQAVIRTIRQDGLARAASLSNSEIRFYQFLPLYDLTHLGSVLTQGYSPTSGEMTWAVVDGCFVIADVLSLAAVQPEGTVALESVRSEVKAAVREGARSAARDLVERAGESSGRTFAGSIAGRGAASEGARAAGRWGARWWTVRSAGGIYQVLERLPEALPKLSLDQLVAMARPLASRAGLRLSSWKPIQLLREGVSVTFRIPPQRGLKYVAAQMVQATVGTVGFQKMEEHMASRRPRRS